jgi:hypothetical protein
MKTGHRVAFFVLAAIILLGPIYGHFFATGSAKYLGWKMFSRKATGFCAVQYTDAQGAELDRFAVLKTPRDKRRGRHLWRIRDLKAARHIGRSMCKAMGRTAHVKLTARCARSNGWEAMPEEVVCGR